VRIENADHDYRTNRITRSTDSYTLSAKYADLISARRQQSMREAFVDPKDQFGSHIAITCRDGANCIQMDDEGVHQQWIDFCDAKTADRAKVAIDTLRGAPPAIIAAQIDPSIDLKPEKTPEGYTIWTHNRSRVYLKTSGNRRWFYYETPEPSLLRLGVKRGTLLFDGKIRRGDADQWEYDGQSYVFSSKCPPTPFKVHGEVSLDDMEVSMSGAPPSQTSACQVLDGRNERSRSLLFQLVIAEPSSR
jgi:hypothetical protein